MILRAVIPGVVAALLLASCANGRVDTWAPRGERLVGKETGDAVQIIPSRAKGETATVISVVRSFAEDNRLGLCGAAVIASSKALGPTLVNAFDELYSNLVVGADRETWQIVSPRFMRRYYLEVPDGKLDAKDVDFSRLRGNCVLTDREWRPEYGTISHLTLRKTIHYRGDTIQWD